ncbi:MAG: hypothetical protein GY861_13890 [bacterium]|nr:hypothetical protein [bacterium]
MKPLNQKVLIKGIEDKSSKILLTSKTEDPNKVIIKSYIIEKLGKDCNDELAIGQKITMREHHYKINITKKEDKPKDTGIWYFLIDESEIWGVE